MRQIFNQNDFTTFYHEFAPLLWGLILKCNLSQSESEKILYSTFLKAYNLSNNPTDLRKNTLSILLQIAFQEGLPVGLLRECFEKKQPHFSRGGQDPPVQLGW